MFKAGEEVICINAGDNKFITEGKIYKVIFSTNWKVFIINNDNRETGYYPERFKSVKEEHNKDFNNKFNSFLKGE
jgi:hypothetical protein